VRVECARDNLGEKEGVWGGLDPAQRYALRYRHGQNVHRLTGPLKKSYADLARELRVTYGPNDISRIMGISPKVVRYLLAWEPSEEETEAPVASEEAEEVASVTEITERASRPVPFPAKPPVDGDAWVRYGRVVIRGFYLGETEDGEWFLMKVPLSKEYSAAWFKRADVKPVRDIAKVIKHRAGETSRIYGTTISNRKSEARAEAG
jgi:hypothetical protein